MNYFIGTTLIVRPAGKKKSIAGEQEVELDPKPPR